MHTCVHHVSSGRITACVRGEHPLQIQVEEGATAVLIDPPRQVSPHTDYVSEGAVVPRPRVELALPSVSGESIDFNGLPAGTRITLTNEAMDYLDIVDLAEPVVLADAGIYQIMVSPPFPWIKETLTAEVSNG